MTQGELQQLYFNYLVAKSESYISIPCYIARFDNMEEDEQNFPTKIDLKEPINSQLLTIKNIHKTS